jgi:uncharacterized protein
MEQSLSGPQVNPPQRRWQPLGAIERRIVGVLAEKAKTTPDVYPMSVNGICTGCNQKSNRSPLMQLEPSQIEESLDKLRELGAVGFVEGYGRVQKYRHYLYDWLGVDKVELAIMTELLLRGDQTIGELRARASRMEPIADLAALRTVLDSLRAKGLVISLTSEGRGQAVTHALYKPREVEAIKARYAAGGGPLPSEEDAAEAPAAPSHGAPSSVASSAPRPTAPAPQVGSPASAANVGFDAIRQELSTLRQQVARLQEELDEVRNLHAQTADELRTLRESLGG